MPHMYLQLSLLRVVFASQFFLWLALYRKVEFSNLARNLVCFYI
jgi:hypothetical protein